MLNFPEISRTAVRDFTDTVCAYLPADPYAEGARARAAGLSLDENPYLWPPGADEQWATGWRSSPPRPAPAIARDIVSVGR